MSSYLAAAPRERLAQLCDAGSFEEFLPPSEGVCSPHLALLGAPPAGDDGVAVGRAQLDGRTVFVAAQDGGFMGGAVGEVHGAKLTGLLRRAILDQPHAVLLLLDSGGVRLHEANAGLIGIAELMRAILDARAAGVPVLALLGGAHGAFGGAGIAACCANAVIMSDQGRLALSGPQVVESAAGAADYDAADRALIWRTCGGRHRYLLGDCQAIAADQMAAFRQAAIDAVAGAREERAELTLEALEREQQLLSGRIAAFGALPDAEDVWRALGIAAPHEVPLLEPEAFAALAGAHRLGAP